MSVDAPDFVAEEWANQSWQRWLNEADRGNGELTGPATRQFLAAQSAKSCLVELFATNAFCLQKQRAIEHSLYFLESRSELGFGLWHELMRVWHRCLADWQEKKAHGDLQGMEIAESDWKRARRDYCVAKWHGGCLVGAFFSAYLLTWKFK